MSLPVLYSFRRCPYAIRARMALHKAGISWEHREVSLRNKPGAMIAISAKATVPVLQLPDQRIMDESMDIMLWALAQNDPDGWLDADMQASLRLISINDEQFKEDLDRYKYHVRYPEKNQSDYRVAAETFLQVLEQGLGKHTAGGFCANRATIADIAIFPFIRQFAGVDRNWFDNSEYKLLLEWFARMEKKEAFLTVMRRYDIWQPGERVVVAA